MCSMSCVHRCHIQSVHRDWIIDEIRHETDVGDAPLNVDCFSGTAMMMSRRDEEFDSEMESKMEGYHHDSESHNTFYWHLKM